ncbi:MAG: pyrroline-5-carboxylate reductase [Candidatus Bathyarchaeia archaeon]
MLLEKKVGIIGCGKMGEAIVAGLIRTNMVDKENVLVSDVVQDARERVEKRYGVRSTSSNHQVTAESDIVILCVQPGNIAQVLESIAGLLDSKLLISVAAGVTTEYIERILGRKQDVVRAMPNIACTIGEGMTVLSPAKDTSMARLSEAVTVFSAVGRTMVLEERLFDAVTGLSGSGPAYVYMFIEALAEGGLKVGIPKDVAVILAAQTVLGAAKMVLETGEHPSKLKDLVATPGGTTIHGLYELEKGNLRASCISAVESATKRAKELSVR